MPSGGGPIPRRSFFNQWNAMNKQQPETIEAVRIDKLIGDVVSRVHETIATGKHIGVRSGFAAFDNVVGSLLPGNLIVLGGDTGSGKTALAIQLAAMVAG